MPRTDVGTVGLSSPALEFRFMVKEPASTLPIIEPYVLRVESPCRVITELTWPAEVDLSLHISGEEDYIVADDAMVTGRSPLRLEFEITKQMLAANGPSWLINIAGYYAHLALPGLYGNARVHCVPSDLTESDTEEPLSDRGDKSTFVDSDLEFERAAAAAGSKPLCVFWWASWDGIAHEFEPFVKRMSVKFPGVVFLRVNLDHIEGSLTRTQQLTADRILPGHCTIVTSGKLVFHTKSCDRGALKSALARLPK